MDLTHLAELFEVLNSLDSSNEARQTAQSQLISIQRDPQNWPCIPAWLSNTQRPQIQFFAAQCLLVRINRDWDTLEEVEQAELRDMIVAILENPGSLTQAARNKLEECLVRVMEKAFVSGWWKDPIGDLMNNSADYSKSFNLVSLIPTKSTNPDEGAPQKAQKASYAWQHEIKSRSQQVIQALKMTNLQSDCALECIKNWCAFGAFSYAQIEELIPELGRLLQQEKADDDEDKVEEIVDCLVEITELSTRDPAEEARKANSLIPICLFLAGGTCEKGPESLAQVIKLASAVCEECSHFLVQNCHQSHVQNYLNLLLHLTQSLSIIDDSDNPGSQMILNAWYALTEAVDSEIESSNSSILVNLFGPALGPIILSKSTLPAPNIWSLLARPAQQNFLQIRREFLDTLIYLQRALASLKAPNFLLEMIYADLAGLPENPKTFIEVRLRALIIISEESNESESDTNCDGGWNLSWQRTANLIFTNPEITKDLINAKLAISLIGSLLPLMICSDQIVGEAVKMLLSQLQSAPALQEECISALQQAADANVPLLDDPEIIAHLIQLLSEANSSSSQSALIKLISQLIVNLADESVRWASFNALIRAAPINHLPAVLKAPFAFKSPEIIASAGNSAYGLCLSHLKSETNHVSGAALLAAWTSLAAADAFYPIEGTSTDPWPLIETYCRSNDNDKDGLILGCKLGAAYVDGMVSTHPQICVTLLDALNQIILHSGGPEEEEALEALFDAWIIVLRKASVESACFLTLQAWTLNKISQGHLSVPFLRTLVRFLCALLENRPLLSSSNTTSLHAIIQTTLFVGITGKIGRSGIELCARILHDISILHPDTFRSSLQQILSTQIDSINETDKKAFLRNIGAAHTIKKFKTVLVEFCLQSRGIIDLK